MSVELVTLPRQSGGYSNSKSIKTINGIFYTGMTRNDARAIGREKCFLRRDFNNLDKNKDNVLTNDEIMQERERQEHMMGLDVILCGLFALNDVVSIIKGQAGFISFLFAALFAACAVDSLNSKQKAKAVNEELTKQLRVNV